MKYYWRLKDIPELVGKSAEEVRHFRRLTGYRALGYGGGWVQPMFVVLGAALGVYVGAQAGALSIGGAVGAVIGGLLGTPFDIDARRRIWRERGPDQS